MATDTSVTNQTGFVLPYSRRDFGDILAWLKQQLPQVSEGQWTDYEQADPGYTLLSAVVALYDFNAFYIDQTLSETMLSTCALRESGVRAANALGYNVALAQPASVSMQITNPSLNFPVAIPTNSAWLINNITFTCVNQINIQAQQTSTTVNLIQGSPYTPAPISAPGTPWFKITIPRNAANIVVAVNGTTWVETDSWSNVNQSTPNTYKRYEVPNGQTIEFGAGTASTMPIQGDEIVITAVLTSGSAGNINASGLNATLLNIVRDPGNASITNLFTGSTLTAADGGQDIETLESIKQNAPAIHATAGRAVTTDDIKAFVLDFPGVTDCRVQGVEEGAPKGYYIVTVYSSDPANVTPDFLAAVKAYLVSLDMACMTPIVQAPSVIYVSTNATIGVYNNLNFVSQTNVQTEALTALSAFFGTLKISGSLYLSNVSEAIENIGNVDHVNMSFSLTSSAAPSGTGYLVIPIATNADLSNATLVDSQNNIIISGNLTANIVNGQFVYQNNSLTAQQYTLSYVPKVAIDGTNVLVPEGSVVVNSANTITVTLVPING